METSLNRYSPGEEIANSITHGVGIVLAIAALCILTVFAGRYGNAWHVVSVSVYGTTLILLYTASTLYHSIQNRSVKGIFQILDHSAIYLLIAGTYTPFTLVNLRGPLGWSIFGIIWGLAAVGVTAKLFFVGRGVLLVGVYIAMGWFVVLVLKPTLAAIPTAGIVWLLAGGLAYTLGVSFYAWKKMPYHHAIWHLFVLTGSVCHYFAVLLYVLPER